MFYFILPCLPGLKVTHLRKSNRVHDLDLYLVVHKFVSVHLKIKPDHLSKNALYTLNDAIWD